MCVCVCVAYRGKSEQGFTDVCMKILKKDTTHTHTHTNSHTHRHNTNGSDLVFRLESSAVLVDQVGSNCYSS